jgi:hypothetical protein
VYACDGKNKTRIRVPLGMWETKNKNEDSPWETYYDTETKVVYEKNPDGWSSAKITTSIGRKMLCLPTPNMQVSAEQVPNSAVPADIRKNATHWRIIYQPRQQVAEKSNTDELLTHQSFEQFLAKQSTQTQRLLSSGTLDSTEAREQKSAGFAAILQTPNKVIIGASDGDSRINTERLGGSGKIKIRRRRSQEQVHQMQGRSHTHRQEPKLRGW